jgi:hypothetical protein
MLCRCRALCLAAVLLDRLSVPKSVRWTIDVSRNGHSVAVVTGGTGLVVPVLARTPIGPSAHRWVVRFPDDCVRNVRFGIARVIPPDAAGAAVAADSKTGAGAAPAVGRGLVVGGMVLEERSVGWDARSMAELFEDGQQSAVTVSPVYARRARDGFVACTLTVDLSRGAITVRSCGVPIEPMSRSELRALSPYAGNGARPILHDPTRPLWSGVPHLAEWYPFILLKADVTRHSRATVTISSDEEDVVPYLSGDGPPLPSELPPTAAPVASDGGGADSKAAAASGLPAAPVMGAGAAPASPSPSSSPAGSPASSPKLAPIVPLSRRASATVAPATHSAPAQPQRVRGESCAVQ